MADVLALINGSYRVIASGLPSNVAEAIRDGVSAHGGRAVVNHRNGASSDTACASHSTSAKEAPPWGDAR